VSTDCKVVPLQRADADSDLVHIADGQYPAIYKCHVGVIFFTVPKLAVYFRLIEHPGLVLSRWYHVIAYRGRVQAGRSSDIVREISAVLGRRVPRHRIPVASLAGLIVKVEVKTVTKDRRQRALAPVNQYSCIERLLERIGP
jgi:hypothetical protein